MEDLERRSGDVFGTLQSEMAPNAAYLLWHRLPVMREEVLVQLVLHVRDLEARLARFEAAFS